MKKIKFSRPFKKSPKILNIKKKLRPSIETTVQELTNLNFSKFDVKLGVKNDKS